MIPSTASSIRVGVALHLANRIENIQCEIPDRIRSENPNEHCADHKGDETECVKLHDPNLRLFYFSAKYELAFYLRFGERTIPH